MTINALPSDERDYLTERAAADYLGVTLATLRNSRYRGHLLSCPAPTWLRLGTRVMYRRDDLRAWVEAHAVERGESPHSNLPTPRRVPVEG